MVQVISGRRFVGKLEDIDKGEKGVVFEKCVFVGVKWVGLEEGRFLECVFEGEQVGGKFRGCVFNRCNWTSGVWKKAVFYKCSWLKSQWTSWIWSSVYMLIVYFEECVMSSVAWKGCYLVDFIDSEGKWTRCGMVHGTQMLDVFFQKTSMEDVLWNHVAIMYSFVFDRCRLKKMTLKGLSFYETFDEEFRRGHDGASFYLFVDAEESDVDYFDVIRSEMKVLSVPKESMVDMRRGVRKKELEGLEHPRPLVATPSRKSVKN